MSSKRTASRNESAAYLLPLLPPGAKLYGTVESVARSGMSRTASFYIVRDGDIQNITGHVAAIVGERRRDDGTIRLNGCGMDMLAWATMEVSAALYGRDHGQRNTGTAADGPYALRPASR